jgi:hypothetical protein
MPYQEKMKKHKLFSILLAILYLLDEIRTEYAKNPETFSIINNLNQYLEFEWKNDILWYKWRIHLNTNSRFKAKVLQEYHDFLTTGHVGLFKTYYNLQRSFFWKGMSSYIQKYVAKCDLCQRKKNENVLTPRLLHPLHIPNQKWE